VNTTAIPVSGLQSPSRSRLTARLSHFVSLMKPRVMLLAVFTALVGLVIAPGHLDPLLGLIAIFGIAAGAGASGVLNMWYEADIDAVMARTARRPIPRGKVSRAEALVFGLVLASSAVGVLALALNVRAAALLAFTIFFMLAIVIPTMLATLGVAYWFRSSNKLARYLPNFDYSGRLEVLVWSIPAMTSVYRNEVGLPNRYVLSTSAFGLLGEIVRQLRPTIIVAATPPAESGE
jgi:UbiA prenyltransferase family